jgi:ribonuclease P protein component
MPPVRVKIGTIKGFGAFTRIITQGRKYQKKPVKAFVFSTASGNTSVYAGFTVTRNTGKAVQRNRFKRLMREAFRLGSVHLIRRMSEGISTEIVFMYVNSPENQKKRIQYSEIKEAIANLCSVIHLTP